MNKHEIITLAVVVGMLLYSFCNMIKLDRETFIYLEYLKKKAEEECAKGINNNE